jgi:hypothetical protein
MPVRPITNTPLALLLSTSIIAGLCFCLQPPFAVYAAASQQIVNVSGPVLQGSLPQRYNAHYLGLEATIRDGVVTMTLAFEPQDPTLRGLINFLVLTEDGLRRYLAGGDADELNIASGAPLQFDPVGNKMAAAFRDSGRGKYTVIVYNNSDVPISYVLTATGGLLSDGSNQTQTAASSAAQFTAATTLSTTQTAAPALLPGAITARRVTGSLTRRPERHYLSVQPDIRDGFVFFNFEYDPLDIPALIGNVNFWVLDEDALRRLVAGAEPDEINLATGFPAPFSPFFNELQASFNASGKNPYTVVVYNNAEVAATYVLGVDGGVLLDQYGQTNEARVAAAEVAAINAANSSQLGEASTTLLTTPASVTPANASPFTISTIASATNITDANLALARGVERLAGLLDRPYEHHYLGLDPTIRDGLIILTLDFDPKDNQALAGNLNFWVLDEDGLRRVISGAPPASVGIATGSAVRFGADQGKLRAIINASGRGRYTVVVFNNSAAPARYELRANGGLLSDETAQTTLP